MASTSAELSERELQVLQMIADGWSNAQIAERLTLSVKTVEAHREHVIRKLAISPISADGHRAYRRNYTTLLVREAALRGLVTFSVSSSDVPALSGCL